MCNTDFFSFNAFEKVFFNPFVERTFLDYNVSIFVQEKVNEFAISHEKKYNFFMRRTIIILTMHSKRQKQRKFRHKADIEKHIPTHSEYCNKKFSV